MNTLTRKQKEIVAFLIQNHQAFEHPPSLDELCLALGLKSRGSLHRLIQGLIEADLIETMDRKRRGIRLTEKAKKIGQESIETPNSLRYVGMIAAGKPIEAIEEVRYITIPDEIKTDQSCYV
jgi:repressor LexA